MKENMTKDLLEQYQNPLVVENLFYFVRVCAQNHRLWRFMVLWKAHGVCVLGHHWPRATLFTFP